METIFNQIAQQLQAKQDVVLVTIVAGSGSTPRGAGAHMWVASNGTQGGTIGGGNVEYQSYLRAKEVLAEKTSAMKGFNLSQGDQHNINMICGGQIVVCFQYIDHENQDFIALCHTILAQFEKKRRENTWLVMDITDEIVWSFGVYAPSLGLVGMEGAFPQAMFQTKAVRMTHNGRLYYSEPVIQGGTVYVFGAGHVAKELVPVLSHLGFPCVVLDDRMETVSGATDYLVCDFENIGQVVDIQAEDYVVIMTRGHAYDLVLQAQALRHNPRYIGIIGSRSKIAILTQKLIAQGFTQGEIRRCHMPIGLDIGAETPAEIAISIAAELIAIRKGG